MGGHLPNHTNPGASHGTDSPSPEHLRIIGCLPGVSVRSTQLPDGLSHPGQPGYRSSRAQDLTGSLIAAVVTSEEHTSPSDLPLARAFCIYPVSVAVCRPSLTVLTFNLGPSPPVKTALCSPALGAQQSVRHRRETLQLGSWHGLAWQYSQKCFTASWRSY